jgi:hypothetical protein
MNEISMPALMLLMSASSDIGRERNKRLKNKDDADGLDGERYLDPMAMRNDAIMADFREKDN